MRSLQERRSAAPGIRHPADNGQAGGEQGYLQPGFGNVSRGPGGDRAEIPVRTVPSAIAPARRTMRWVFGIIRLAPRMECPSLFEAWRAHLCGLCLTLRDGQGQAARLTTNYDTMVISVLTVAQLPSAAPDRRAVRARVPPGRGGGLGAGGARGARLAAVVSLVLAAGKLRDHAADGDDRLGTRTARRRLAAGGRGRLPEAWQAAEAPICSHRALIRGPRRGHSSLARRPVEASAYGGAPYSRHRSSLRRSSWRARRGSSMPRVRMAACRQSAGPAFRSTLRLTVLPPVRQGETPHALHLFAGNATPRRARTRPEMPAP
ncbi:DUF5685 family protein [Nonomuraea sp. 3N208]|uniref:DUF5685 family protein n=1 Tax=Nonomuraea sp. 3N208 TaxID=3457421 RepID=UPI003FCCED0B